MTKRIRRVVPVLPTPFRSDGRVDTRSFASAAEHTFALGVTAVMFPGFASEHAALTGTEKDDLLRQLVALARPYRVAVVGAVTDFSTDVAVWHAREVATFGVDAINVIPSTAARSSDDVLVLLREVADAVAPLPVVAQYVPAHMSTTLDVEHFRRLAEQAPNLCAVKVESRPCGPLVAALRDGHPSLPSLVGNGGVELLPALHAGAVGVQPGGGFVDVYVEIWRRFESGETAGADRLFGRLLGYLEGWFGSLTKVGKVIAARRGLIATDRCRRPEQPLSATALADIDRFLDEFADILAPVGAVSPTQRGDSA